MNKRFSFVLMLTLSIVFCSVLSAEEDVFYLHCFSPTYGQAIQWEGSPKVEKPTAPARLITLKVQIDQDFEAILHDQSGVSGKISKVDGSMAVDIKGSFGSGFEFSGKVELNSIFETHLTWFSGAAFTTLCVLSKDKNIEPFLKAQANADSARLERKTKESKRNAEEHRKKAEQAAPSDGEKPQK